MRYASIRTIGFSSPMIWLMLALVACGVDKGLPSTEVEAKVKATVEALQTLPSTLSETPVPDTEALVEETLETAMKEAFLEGLQESLNEGVSDKETVFTGLEKVRRGSIQLDGSVFANGDLDKQLVTSIVIRVSNSVKDGSVDLTEPVDADGDGISDYDSNHRLLYLTALSRTRTF